MTDQKTEEIKEEIEYQTISDFLESTPPNQLINISDLANRKRGYMAVKTPEIQLHCDSEKCNGVRFFRCVSGTDQSVIEEHFKFHYFTYRCSNCQNIEKTFSLAVKLDEYDTQKGVCYKFGELPAFGPTVSSRLLKLIGPDRDDFLKGRRCENQGLGIGAFIYYRRVVENQKNRILEQIIKVSKKISAPTAKLQILESATKETQFSKSLNMAKDAMPESLLINGHSPILLLHSALSEGVHDLSDEHCLEIAGSVRIVLSELSDRLSQALKDEAELTKALSTLMNKKK